MPYIMRDANGRIAALFAEADPTCGLTEELPCDHPEVTRFLGSNGSKSELIEQLAVSDRDMVRVVEDLIHALIAKGVILFTDLPGPARRKLLARRRLREQLNPLAGMIRSDEDDIL
jgi:hypothetical protein